MNGISAANPNEEEQKQEISIKEFMKTKKQFLENMQLMFQKHATATLSAQSSGPYSSRTDEKNSNDPSQQESYDRGIHKKIPSASRKGVNQDGQNSQDIVTLHPSDSDNYLSEDSICQRKDSEDPLSQYPRVESDAKVEGGDQDNSYKDLLASVQEDFGPPIETISQKCQKEFWEKLSWEIHRRKS